MSEELNKKVEVYEKVKLAVAYELYRNAQVQLAKSELMEEHITSRWIAEPNNKPLAMAREKAQFEKKETASMLEFMDRQIKELEKTV